ncbi:MAG TPA: NACHT domain-containing protein [Pyrinomonadaceae bacterium]|jgi:hypothetical protein
MGIAEFALSVIGGLITNVIQAGINFSTQSYFERRRILRRVEDATAEVVEPLLPFLENERIEEDKQRRLIQTCVDELKPFTENPEPLFQGSLDGQKIFEKLYANRELPEVIVEDGLKEIYTLLFPRIATLLCKIPIAVKDWENQAWSENFRRFDEIAKQMRSLFYRVDELGAQQSKEADEVLSVIRRALAQKVGFDLDLTGLRADKPLAGKFDDFFVHPEIKRVLKDKEGKDYTQSLNTPKESFEYFIFNNGLSVTIGTAGAGKSTWSKWLQREALSPNWTGIAIRIELRQISVSNTPSLHQIIRDAAGKHLAEDITSERITKWLETKQVLFIFDGFDEIKPSERDDIYNWIVDLVMVSHECSIIVTSRPLTTNHIEQFCNGAAPWNIEPFNEPRVIDYVEKWYRHTPLIQEEQRDVDAGNLAKTWINDSTIGHLTGNPLLLSTLLMVHHLDGSLPSGRSQLYRRYVEGMLGIWDDRRQVSATSVELTLEQKRQILRGFALYLFLIEEDQLDETKVLEWLNEQLGKMSIKEDANIVLNSLRERSGLIIGPGVYNFAHKSIAEYLVAETILQGDQRDLAGQRFDRFLLFEHRDDDRWNTVTFLWAGLAPIADLESFIDASIDRNNIALGAGLLLDQFDRIPREIARRLLLKITKKEIEFQLGRRHWIVSTSDNPNTYFKFKLPIPSFDIRKLSSGSDFEDLIFSAVNKGVIVWNDIHETDGHFRDLIWMSFTVKRNDLEQWGNCLKESFPKTAEQNCWLFWIAENLFVFAMLKSNQESLDNAVSILQEVHPSFEGYLPIALVSAVSNVLYKGQEQNFPFDIEKTPHILFVLTQFKSVDSNLLNQTHQWRLAWNFNDEPIDLLDYFIDEIKKLAIEGQIKDSSLYNNVNTYINRLKDQRISFEEIEKSLQSRENHAINNVQMSVINELKT